MFCTFFFPMHYKHTAMWLQNRDSTYHTLTFAYIYTPISSHDQRISLKYTQEKVKIIFKSVLLLFWPSFCAWLRLFSFALALHKHRMFSPPVSPRLPKWHVHLHFNLKDLSSYLAFKATEWKVVAGSSEFNCHALKMSACATSQSAFYSDTRVPIWKIKSRWEEGEMYRIA